MLTNGRLPSLRTFIVRQQFKVGAFLILSFALLFILNAWNAAEKTTNEIIKAQAKNLASSLKAAKNSNSQQRYAEVKAKGQLAELIGQEYIYFDWDSLPKAVIESIDLNDVTYNDVYESEIRLKDGSKIYLILFLFDDVNLGQLIYASFHSIDEIEQYGHQIFLPSLTNSLLSSAIVFLIVFFFVRGTIIKLGKPISVLDQWASNSELTLKSLAEKDFVICETFQIASHLAENVNRLQAFDEREREFLKFASHEFRTPLAIMQASLDTLDARLSDDKTVHRALRANKNLQSITASLLWISRESNLPLEKNSCDIKKIVNEAITSADNLLDDKKFDLQVYFHSPLPKILIEVDPLKIVISNIIRNSFQHKSEGKVDLTVDANHISIANQYQQNSEKRSSLKTTEGFGIGLLLTRKICEKFDWIFETSRTATYFRVIITWNPQE